jgi:hypothetical protein
MVVGRAVGQLGRNDVIVRFPLSDQEAKLLLDQLVRLHVCRRDEATASAARPRAGDGANLRRA